MHNGDLVLRCSNDSTKKTIIQNAPGTQLTTWANHVLLLHEYDLSISGVLQQSPLTSILGVSIANTDLKIGAIIGVTLNQKYLQRNEGIVPATFGNYLLNDNLTLNSQANTNSYIQFGNTVTTNNSFYIGKVGSSDLVTGAMIFKKSGTENSRIDTSGNWVMNNNLTVSGVLQSPLTNTLGVSVGNVESFKQDKLQCGRF